MTENSAEQGFEDPIVSGKLSSLPTAPKEGEPVWRDYFFVEGLDVYQDDIKNIILPKFIMNKLNPNVGFAEKGLLLFTLDGNHENGVYSETLKMIKNGVDELKIHFYVPDCDEDEEKDNGEGKNEPSFTVVSTWTFTGLTVQAVDFGYIAPIRPELPEVSVEFDYHTFKIDDIEM